MVRFDVPEGATPIEEASGLLLDGVLTYGDLNAAETENILAAVNKHLRSGKRRAPAWLREEYVRRVHRDMFDGVWDWAGRYRDSALTIGIDASLIREEVEKLCRDVAFWDAQEHDALQILERAARLHHRLAWIHPFSNGNGRHARLMADIYLFVKGHPLPVWPSGAMSGAGEARTAYLEALRRADGGDFGPLVAYTVRFLPQTG
ncbi:MAG: mobile mystery protein B [Elusimicrobia bacterium]|nr:mobile mystery protein B [Elusimicrobiota bacterium]